MSDFKDMDEEAAATAEATKPKRLKIRNTNCDDENSRNSSAKLMEKFVRKGQNPLESGTNSPFDEFKSELIDLKEFCSFICPHCAEAFEGNRDFFDQHIDSCFNNNGRL